MNLDAKDMKVSDLSDSAYTLGALKIHHVKRLNLKPDDLYLTGKCKHDLDKSV